MTPLQATQLVYDAVRTGWDDRTPIGFEGERFVRPTDQAYVFVSVRDLPNQGATLGRPGQRLASRRSMVFGQVFAPTFPDDGVGAAMALAAQLQALLEGLDVPSAPGADNLNFGVADTRRIGVDGTWYQVNVSAPFVYLESF